MDPLLIQRPQPASARKKNLTTPMVNASPALLLTTSIRLARTVASAEKGRSITKRATPARRSYAQGERYWTVISKPAFALMTGSMSIMMLAINASKDIPTAKLTQFVSSVEKAVSSMLQRKFVTALKSKLTFGIQ
jgi:hypothetical protein